MSGKSIDEHPPNKPIDVFTRAVDCARAPREIVTRCPDEFTTEQEIYRLHRNGLERLKRHQDTLVHRLGWKLSGDKEQKPEIGSVQTSQKEAHLTVLSNGQSIPLRGELMVVGRQDPTLGIFPEISLADKTVGRRHAYLHNKQGTYTVEDLNALNKTRLNGVTLTPPLLSCLPQLNALSSPQELHAAMQHPQ